MSQELDNILHKMSTASSSCYDLNRDSRLSYEEQTVFYQFAEHILLLLTDMHSHYDNLSNGLDNKPDVVNELTTVWDTANTALEDFSRSITSPKMRTAVTSTAYAIDRTSSVIDSILNQ